MLYIALLGICSKSVGLEVGDRRHADAIVAWKRLQKNRQIAGMPMDTIIDIKQRDISRERWERVFFIFWKMGVG